ncbi:MAG TPA: hypothetical protein PLH94_00610 [Fimbriimonadaceae bacterium]|nr:hypothetical protein [Fimbriimonadaceae bacterium]
MSDYLEIHALADGELSAQEQVRVRDRIESDPRAKAEFVAVTLVKSTVQTRCVPVANDEVWSACRERLDAIDKTKRVEGFVGRYAWALCLGFLIMIVGAASFNRMPNRQSVDTGDMARMVAGMTPIPMPTQKPPAEVQRWAERQLDGAPVQLPAESMQVQSLSRGLYEGRRAMMVRLADARGSVALLVVEDTHSVEGMQGASDARLFGHGQVDGMNCISWVEDGVACLLVGARPPMELEGIAQQIRLQR